VADQQQRADQRPDLALIQRLLGALHIPFDPPSIQAAAERSGGRPAERSTSQWLHEVLAAAEVKQVAAVELPWQRFDPSRLPALIRHQDRWFFAAAADSDGVLLTGADGGESRLAGGQLDGAQVLWIRRPAVPAAGAARSLSDNLASQLVWSELFRERGWLWQVAVATCLVNLIGVSTSLFAMQVYDRVVPTLAYATLTALVAGMAIVVVLDWSLKMIRTRILDSLAFAVDQRVSQRVFEHLLHVRLDALPRSLGSLAARVGSLDAVRQFFSATVVFALIDLPFALMFLGFIALIGGPVAWVYALLLPLALLLGFAVQWRLRGLMREQISRSNERQGLLVDSIRGAESIRANNAGWRFAGEWRDITTSINLYGIQQRAISSLSGITTSSLSIVAYVSAVVVGVWQIEAGLLTMGGLIACSILGGRIIAPVAQSVQYLVQWQHVDQALNMVHEVLELKPERRTDQQLLLPGDHAARMALDGVRFAYAESPIRQLSIDHLQLEPGDRVLLAGPVGSGKSTLLKVLAGLYRPGEGRVRLGGADLWETDPLLVATQIGYLPQSVHLFRGTLRSNLCLNGAASDDHLLQVSEQLGIDRIAAGSPLGMDLPISEGGEGLSGGQRQLVALARVFVNRPRIWLLDEPTASLDRENEQRVWDALQAALRPSDILVVSTHRPLMSSALVNRVLILQQGRVVQDGKPDALLPQLARRPSPPPGGNGGRIDVV